MKVSLRVLLLAALWAAGCADPEQDRLKQTTIPTYDKTTGRLKELTYDYNKNGKIDTWTEMDGARPVLSKMDTNEDGTVDRWEYYDDNARLVKVGFSRGNTGKPDAWAFSGPDGQVERVEISSAGDPGKIDRWERYRAGTMVEADEDTNADGRADKWETFENGAVKTVAFDEDRNGVADRRLVYQGGDLVAIESEPDQSGVFQKRVAVK